MKSLTARRGIFMVLSDRVRHTYPSMFGLPDGRMLNVCHQRLNGHRHASRLRSTWKMPVPYRKSR